MRHFSKKFVDSHEYVDVSDGIATIGISEYAQSQLGEIVYVELPEVGDAFDKGEVCGCLESVKAASDCYSPVTGEVIEVNEGLEDTPDLVNDDPYGEGWIFKVKISEPSEMNEMMDEKAYAAHIEE